MTRLAGTDALSLHTQSSKAPADTLTLVIVDDPSTVLSHEKLHRLVAASLPQLARFRSRLVAKPLGMGQPVWAEIDDYDPFPQIHCATVRPPGGRRELAELVAELTARGPDSRHRLWEAWSVDGLLDGRWALAVKMSAALNDGVAGAASMWPRLLTRKPRAHPDRSLPSESTLGAAPSVGELVVDLVAEMVENHVTGGWLIAEAVSNALRAVSGRLFGTSGRDPMAHGGSSMSGPVPHTLLNAPLTKRRAVAFASIPLADLKTVNSAFGGSITNVVLAACTLSLRAWLQSHDKVPTDPLLMRMPFELPASDPPKRGKALTSGRFRIPVHLDDPVQVLANLHTATERLNALRGHSRQRRPPADDVDAIASLIPPAVANLGMQLYTRSGLRHQLKPIYHGSVSYTAFEPVPAYCAGARVVGVHTVAPLSEENGLNIALTTRGEELDVSVCVCPDNVPAVDDIATGIAHGVDILVAAARESPRGQGRSVVTELSSHPAHRSRDSAY
ncbi:wax ester/triacylglycerol synthase domain-containing protein [Mycobacterium sp. 852002-53434_SCH5985345]|uniref:wax ester/triacylglycerol synthase domain-containing protein n=1 Tax=Mycobacterium sp. 852002-53434_SCH5985345 TaxID=1834107 RepID=UPI001E5460C3|nr:wax ester/triacylglycerol synthase domain-containing protein [Mycobacterium sp. 852002-53434_SCH5985345]